LREILDRREVGVQSSPSAHTDSAPVRSTELLLRLAVGIFRIAINVSAQASLATAVGRPAAFFSFFARIFSARISISVQSTVSGQDTIG